MDCFIIYNNMIMRKIIYIVIRVVGRIVVPEIAFNSAKEAEEYGKQKYDANKDYNWYVSTTFLEDKK